jgi:Tfp pilus assembly protein PilF
VELAIVGTWLAKEAAWPLVVNIASNVLGEHAPKWLTKYKNHDVPIALRKAWRKAVEKVFADFVEEAQPSISPDDKRAVRELAAFLSEDKTADAIFPEGALQDPLRALRETPVEAFALKRLEAQRRIGEMVQEAARLGRPKLQFPPHFFPFVQERLSTALFYFFVEIAIKEDEKAREQIQFEHNVDTFKRLCGIQQDIEWLREENATIKSILVDGPEGGVAGNSKRAADNTDEIKRMLSELLAHRPAVLAAVAAPSTMLTTPARNSSSPTNIPAPEAHWIHRKEITRSIRAMLRSGNGTASLTAAVATAAGGYGKTFAARIYAFEHANDYPGGRFELTMDKGNLQAGLASLLPLLSPGADLPPSQAAPAVKAMLEAHPPSLLVLDNIPNLAAWHEHVACGLVPGGHCHVLLTTRDADVLPGRAVQVPRFTTEEAWTILAQARPDALDQAHVTWVGRVLRAIDGLGVVVGAVAARMQASPHTSWRLYWNTLVQAAPTLFADGALPPLLRELAAEPDEAQKARWHVMLDDCFATLPPALQRALEYTALMPPDLMPRVWLATLLANDPTVKPPVTGASVVDDLLAKRVLTLADGAGNLLSLHRLWHARLNERAAALKDGRAGLWAAIGACAMGRRAVIVGRDEPGKPFAIDNPNVLTDPSVRWELAPLAEVCAVLWQRGNAGAAAGIAVWLAPPMRRLGRFADALACLLPLEKHESAVETALGAGEVATCYSNLAAIQKDQGDLPGARASMERAIAIAEKHLGPDHPNLAAMRSNLATILQDQGDLPGARASMERAIAVNQKHFAPDHPTFAIRYCNLAAIQKDQGDLPGARASMERAIDIEEKHFALDHPTLATSYSNLAMIQQDQGDLSGARASMERAIAIDEKHFAPDHPTFATRYNNLAGICFAEGDRAAACANLKKALGILLKHFGEDHPHVKIVRRGMRAVGCPDGG